MIERCCKLLVVPTLLVAGCAIDEPEYSEKSGETDQPLVLSDSLRLSEEGLLNFGTVVFAENPTTLLEQGDFHAYEIEGKAGGRITISMRSGTGCGRPDTFLFLFGPEDEDGNRGSDIARNDDAFESPCILDSKIRNFTLPVTGTYLIVATSFLQQGGGNYRLLATCDNGACVPDDAETFAKSRISQTDINNGVFTPDELFEIGDFLFGTIYRLQDGMGNALIGEPAGNNPPPNFRRVHFAAFGAPEAQSCLTCHNIGGDDGAGDLNHNIFQIGDGVNPASGVPRNPPVVLGNGLRQRVGAEMTAQLQAQRAAGLAAADAQNTPVTVQLRSKNVSFGSLIANPDGTVNTAGVRGVDPDLIVRPFGWKGREALLRRFVEGGFRVHFGMQTQPSVDRHCITPNINTFGDGPDCQDPDGDGKKEEITEGQLSANAIYMGLLEMPIRVPPTTSTGQLRAAQGEQIFNAIGCASCHVRAMRINSPIFTEPADSGGPGITMNLAVDMKEPRPVRASDGSMTFELWSDFKRHDMGAALADAEPFNQIAANQFITTPLWGVATSAPYLHDGRAPTLRSAILQHGGEAQTVRNNFALLSSDNQAKVVEFLGTLSRTSE